MEPTPRAALCKAASSRLDELVVLRLYRCVDYSLYSQYKLYSGTQHGHMPDRKTYINNKQSLSMESYPTIDLRPTPEGALDTRRTVLDTKKAVLLPAGQKLSHPSLLPTHSPLSKLAVSLAGDATLDTTKSSLDTQRSVHSGSKSGLDTTPSDSKDKNVAAVESNSTSKETNLTSPDPPASTHPSSSATKSISPVSSAEPPSPSKKYKKVRWIPDEERPACALCPNEFGFFVWRHHCRYYCHTILLHEQLCCTRCTLCFHVHLRRAARDLRLLSCLKFFAV